MDKAINIDLGLFIARLALGVIFLAHGIQKFIAMGNTIAFFDQIGLAVFFVYLVAIAEVLSGLAMLLGVWTRFAGTIIIIIMIFAMFLVKFAMGFFAGYEYDLVLLLMALAIIFSGSGKYSLGGKR